MRTLSLFALATCFAVAPSYGANREMQELQRDVAQLQDQLRRLQSGFDVKTAALQTLVQQALDDANKLKISVSDLNSQMNKVLRGLADISNAIKVVQTTVTAPPTPPQVDAN